MLIDAHTHLQSDRLIDKVIDLKTLIDRMRSAGVTACVSCGVSPADWPELERISRRAREDFDFPIFPQFGLHPWRVKDAENGWLDQLRRKLVEHPEAGLGEIGLDAHFPGLADFQTQMTACEQQLQLAAELNRSVTFHCVRAFSETALLIKRVKFTGKLVMHAFSGSKEQVKQLVGLSPNIFISIGNRMVKEDVIASIPLDRVLAETDSPDQVGDAAPGGLPQLVDADGKRLNDPSQVVAVVSRIAAAHSISFKEAASITRENVSRAFSLQP